MKRAEDMAYAELLNKVRIISGHAAEFPAC